MVEVAPHDGVHDEEEVANGGKHGKHGKHGRHGRHGRKAEEESVHIFYISVQYHPPRNNVYGTHTHDTRHTTHSEGKVEGLVG